MLRHAIISFAFVLSFTAAHAETQQSYFGVSGILDAKLDYDTEALADVTIDSGFILSFGRDIGNHAAIEFAYARYVDISSFGGLVQAEVDAVEISAVASTGLGGPFFRVGYSDGDLSSRVGDLTQSESESGVLLGIGADLLLPHNFGLIRFEYTTIDYDNADANRLTLGTIVRF